MCKGLSAKVGIHIVYCDLLRRDNGALLQSLTYDMEVYSAPKSVGWRGVSVSNFENVSMPSTETALQKGDKKNPIGHSLNGVRWHSRELWLQYWKIIN